MYKYATNREYNNICKQLGFNPACEFVKITNKGTISFTAGKPCEIKALYQAVINNNFKPSRKLTEICKKL